MRYEVYDTQCFCVVALVDELSMQNQCAFSSIGSLSMAPLVAVAILCSSLEGFGSVTGMGSARLTNCVACVQAAITERLSYDSDDPWGDPGPGAVQARCVR